MADYHESIELLDEKAKNISRALKSIKEEIEAIDWYHQRISVSQDQELKSVLVHNRDEEIEHAVMLMEWLRRNMDSWDNILKEYLFKEGPIKEKENNFPNEKIQSLNIGNFR